MKMLRKFFWKFSDSGKGLGILLSRQRRFFGVGKYTELRFLMSGTSLFGPKIDFLRGLESPSRVGARAFWIAVALKE